MLTKSRRMKSLPRRMNFISSCATVYDFIRAVCGFRHADGAYFSFRRIASVLMGFKDTRFFLFLKCILQPFKDNGTFAHHTSRAAFTLRRRRTSFNSRSPQRIMREVFFPRAISSLPFSLGHPYHFSFASPIICHIMPHQSAMP